MPDSGQPYGVTASPVPVLLIEEDLCCSVNIGDVVDIVGQASLQTSGKADSKVLGNAQVCFLLDFSIGCF